MSFTICRCVHLLLLVWMTAINHADALWLWSAVQAKCLVSVLSHSQTPAYVQG